MECIHEGTIRCKFTKEQFEKIAYPCLICSIDRLTRAVKRVERSLNNYIGWSTKKE